MRKWQHTHVHILLQFWKTWELKVGCSHYILIPQGSTGSSTFLVSNEDPIFSYYNPKISASKSLVYTLEVVVENIPISSRPIPILIFLCIFITISSPVSHTHFCSRREDKKQPCGKIVQNVSQGSRLISWEWKIHMSDGHILLQIVWNVIYAAMPFQTWKIIVVTSYKVLQMCILWFFCSALWYEKEEEEKKRLKLCEIWAF